MLSNIYRGAGLGIELADLLIDPKDHDVFDEDIWLRLMARVKTGEFGAALSFPNCSTFCKGRSETDGRPRVLRDEYAR